MTRTLSPLLALLLLTPACGKKQPDTTNPEDATAGDTTGDPTATSPDDPPAETAPPQDPDPAELAEGVHQVLTGHYEEGIAILEPIHSGMTEPSQYRARGLAGGWLAVAHAQIVFENAEGPANVALEMADKLQDPEVDAVAKLGRGAFLLAQEDYAAAKEAFQAASTASPESAPGIYAQVLHGEALIGAAFGQASNTQLENPADLDEAKVHYEAAAAAAGGSADPEILLGRAKEGLAAVAKIKRDQEALCKNAVEAVGHYQAAKASTFLVDGPSRLASDAKCDKK